MFNLKNLINTFDRMMAAITFAEANEHAKALDILYDKPEESQEQHVESRVTKQEEIRPGLRM